MRACIVYLASPKQFTTLPNGEGELRLDALRASLSITKQCLPGIDIFLFHEDFTEKDLIDLPSVTLAAQINLSGFEQFYNPSVRRSYGYFSMCRFFSGVMQNLPCLQNYTHYIRMDDDSFFLQPYIGVSAIDRMMNYDYVYRSEFVESVDQQSLYDFTLAFLRKTAHSPPFTINRVIQSLIDRKIVVNGRYGGFAPYNNFHVSSLRLWRHPFVLRYITEIERIQGIYRYGWLDANIHAMIVFLLGPLIGTRVTTDTNFGYRHNRHMSLINSIALDSRPELPFFPETVSDDVPASMAELYGIQDVLAICAKHSVPVKHSECIQCPASGLGDILERIRHYKQGYGKPPFRINAIFYGTRFGGNYYSNPSNAFEFRILMIRDLLEDNGFDRNALECVIGESQSLSQHFSRSISFDSIALNTGKQSDIPENAIIFHTKFRQWAGADHGKYRTMIREFCRTFVTDRSIVLLGERSIPTTWEVSLHKIGTVYDELCELKSQNTVLDLTTPTLTDCLNYDNWKLDVERIRSAKANITFGLGGMLCMSVCFGSQTLIFLDPNLSCQYNPDMLAVHNHHIIRDLPAMFDKIRQIR